MRCTALPTRARRFLKQFPVLLWLVWAVGRTSFHLVSRPPISNAPHLSRGFHHTV